MDDVRRVLGIFEKAARLRRLGLTLEHIARRLDYTADRMLLHMAGVCEDYVGEALKSDLISSNDATELISRLERFADRWVDIIFADGPDVSPIRSAGEHWSPSSGNDGTASGDTALDGPAEEPPTSMPRQAMEWHPKPRLSPAQPPADGVGETAKGPESVTAGDRRSRRTGPDRPI